MQRTCHIVAAGLGEVLFDRDTVSGACTFGGAPANFAYHFLRCASLLAPDARIESHVVSAIGTDRDGRPDAWGARVLEELGRRGLGAVLTRVADLPTGLVDKRRDEAGVNTYEILPGAWDALVWSPETERLAACCDVGCFGSLAQRSAATHGVVCRFLDAMIASGRPTLRVFDVNIRQNYYSREVLTESIRRCNILKISDEEAPSVAACLTGRPLAGDAETLCRDLLATHARLGTVILTEGGAGSRVFTRTQTACYRIPPSERVKPVDTVGAGHSFTGAFFAMMLLGGDTVSAQRFASKVAAFVCGCESATPDYPAGARDMFLTQN